MTGDQSSHQSHSGRDGSTVGRRSLLIIVTTVLAVTLVIAAIAVLALRDDESATRPGPAATPATSGSVTASPTDEPTLPQPSAAEALDAFFAAAVRLDEQLTTAAAAINATGPPWGQITDDVAGKVRAADLGPVSRAIPAGLPHDLQQSVILVLSDLTSRRMAMESFTSVGPVLPDESDAAHRTTEQLLDELSRGHAAAVRFDGDLAAARALAADTAPIAPVPSRSRLTAEMLVLVEYVRVANAGCDERGGAVFTGLPEVIWRSVPELPGAEGTVGPHHIAFNAELRPDGTWEVYLFAC